MNPSGKLTGTVKCCILCRAIRLAQNSRQQPPREAAVDGEGGRPAEAETERDGRKVGRMAGTTAQETPMPLALANETSTLRLVQERDTGMIDNQSQL